ncbi:MAG: 4-carboxymuconolactone decarboxylase [Rhodospirillaceae bacterium]|nr:4-carboxymuconolactone decarboxylase [Rhodospirillaceae bacterium]MBT3930508.1 4-carboxymuconolactone decarboxylase [Rhodospirillaceae bacterium]MBT4770961.1 4-carboxymuconolactone decarboxylase [Rhodospirillaceae bacterium]MBT5359244.1 4-carboxymuconolactone decarboxylase [Rhodospirillaceae bacterium]MBT5769113.1 4-carboxymuconolactone decarboxylase [Rhodospirillaceae bacterium]
MDKDLFEKGLKIRREVMGDERVDSTMANLNDFNRDFMEEFITEIGWGAVWGRDGLSRKQRSLLNLGMLAALGKMNEFEGHFRGAINNGLTREELREALMQIALYCGAPAGMEAFRAAAKVLKEIDAE